MSEIGKHTRRRKVGADKVRDAILCPFLVATADMAILFPLVGLVSLLIKDVPEIGAEQREVFKRLSWHIFVYFVFLQIGHSAHFSYDAATSIRHYHSQVFASRLTFIICI